VPALTDENGHGLGHLTMIKELAGALAAILNLNLIGAPGLFELFEPSVSVDCYDLYIVNGYTYIEV
jgi:hypothetical protein